MSQPALLHTRPRRILITGASRGIGRTTALALARRGDRVIIAARSAEALHRLAREIEALGGAAEVAVLDVTDADSVRSAADAILAGGPVDVLVNNAGVFRQERFLGQDPAWRRHEMDVNLFGAQRVTEALLPSMIGRGVGTIVNVSSLLGAIPCPTAAHYSATKAALNAWSHALRGEIARHGLRVVVFLPSHTDTEQGRTVRFDGVRALPVAYTASQLVRAIDRAPRTWVASPVFRAIARLAGVFPGWAEARMRSSTEALLAG